MRTYQGRQTKDWKSPHICGKEGLQLPGTSFQDKEEEGLRKRKGRPFGWKVVTVIFVLIVGGLVSWLMPADSVSDPGAPIPPPTVGKVDSTGLAIRMTDITAKSKNGKISIPLDVVKEKKIVRFEYETNGVKIPLLSYIAPSGKVITAVSVCEPCRSTKFHIKGNSIVCNACFAEWDIETLRGIRGGCLNYPPDIIPNTAEKGQIQIDEKSVIQWKPRI